MRKASAQALKACLRGRVVASVLLLPAVLALVRPGRSADDEADDAQADDDANGDLSDDDAADAATVPFGKARIRRAA